MLGGNGNFPFPPFLEDNMLRYSNAGLSQLHLFGEVGCSRDPRSYVANDQAAATSRPVRQGCVFDPNPQQQSLPVSLNNNLAQDKVGLSGSILNPNPVSLGLKLSYEEDERNSSVTSAGENMKAANSGNFSFGNSIQTEVVRQNEELDHYIGSQEENLIRGARDLNQRHADSFLSTIEKVISKKLHEKELEIENMNHKNRELGEKIKQVLMEVQSWHYRAKYNESIVNILRGNLQQILVQEALQPREGCGDSEVDDAVSRSNHNGIASASGFPVSVGGNQLNCKICKTREVSVLLLPCRHLCLCKECIGFIEICPVCQVMKTAIMQVYMA